MHGVVYWYSRLHRTGGPVQTVVWQRQESARMLEWMATGEATVNEN